MPKQKNETLRYIISVLELKTIVLKQSIPDLLLNDVVGYILDIGYKNRSIIDFYEITNFILEISSSKIIEYLNNRNIISDIKLSDFQDMFK